MSYTITKGKEISLCYLYASRTLDTTQVNFTTTEKELWAIIFALDKLRSYLSGTKITVFTNHFAIKFW